MKIKRESSPPPPFSFVVKKHCVSDDFFLFTMRQCSRLASGESEEDDEEG